MRDLEGREHIDAVKALQAAEDAYISSDPGSARSHLERCLMLDPELSRAWELMGMMELLRGDLRASIERMAHVTSGDKALTEAGMVLSLTSSPGWPKGESPVQKVASLAALGQAFLNKGMWAASAVCLRGVEDMVEPGWQILSLMGFVHRQMGHLEVSIGYYDMALEAGGPRDELYFDRALVLLRLGRLEEAADAFKRFSEGPKGSAQSWNDLGVVLEAMGRLGEAMDAYERAIGMDRDYYIALYSMGKLLQRMGRYEEAAPVLQRALDLESRVFDIDDVKGPRAGPPDGIMKVKELMRKRPDNTH